MNRTPTTRRVGHVSVVMSLLVGPMLLTACSSASPAAAPPAAAPTPTTLTSTLVTTPPTSPAPAPAHTAGSSPGRLTPNQRYQLLTILEAVNPGVSTDEAALVSSSFTVCTHITAHESDAAVDAVITDAYSSGQYVPSPEEAQAIRMAIAKTFCFG